MFFGGDKSVFASYSIKAAAANAYEATGKTGIVC